jgi:hypothetical protein
MGAPFDDDVHGLAAVGVLLYPRFSYLQMEATQPG